MKENSFLREFEYEDIEQIIEIENEIFSDPWSKDIIEDEYNNDNTKIFICKKEKKILGYIFLSIILDEAEITNVAVDSRNRGQNIATMLMEQVMEIVETNKLSKILLEVRKSNIAAINLYDKFEFVQNGLRRNYYQDPKEDAILMIKNVALAT